MLSYVRDGASLHFLAVMQGFKGRIFLLRISDFGFGFGFGFESPIEMSDWFLTWIWAPVWSVESIFDVYLDSAFSLRERTGRKGA